MKLNRRQFLSATALVGVGGFLYIKGQKVSFYASEIQTLLSVAYHLYPPSILGFGIKEMHLATYLVFVLKDERILQDDRDYLTRGATWIQEHAQELYKKSFIALKNDEKEILLKDAVAYEWGDSYVNYVFTYIFEAMFCAPVYGSNTNKQGWKFIEHKAGFPQPKTLKDISYV